MRLFADQDVWRVTVGLLRQWGHDVVTAEEVGMSRSSDKESFYIVKVRIAFLLHAIRTLDISSLLGGFPAKVLSCFALLPGMQTKFTLSLKGSWTTIRKVKFSDPSQLLNHPGTGFVSSSI